MPAEDRRIVAGERAAVTGVAAPGTVVQLFAYTRPSTTYTVVRSEVVGADGTYSFSVAPVGNTRMYTEIDGIKSASVVVEVEQAVSMTPTRTAASALRFTGKVFPAVIGQPVSIFRSAPNGGRVLVGRALTNADGRYVYDRTFSGTGTFSFHAEVGGGLVTKTGSSDVRQATIR